MKIKLFVALLAICGIANAQGYWTQKADFGGTGRWCAVGFSIETKGYIGIGYDLDSMRSDFWEYNPSINIWTQKSNLAGSAREYAVCFTIGKKGYIGTGTNGFMQDFWEWDQASNSWSQKANFGGTGRHDAVGFSIGTKGYLGTGLDSDSLRSDFWEYDPSGNIWTQKSNFGGGIRSAAVGFSIDTKGYIGTGSDFTSDKQDFWEYDPDSDAWTQKANLGGVPREFTSGFSIGTKGYIGTGAFFNGTTWIGINDFWEWEQSTNTWTQKADFGGTARMGAVGFSIEGKGYLGTGDDGVGGNNMTKDFWEYTPDSINIVDENIFLSPITVYPNPASEKIIIDASSFKQSESVEISIIDLSGKILRTQKCNWKKNLFLDVKNLDAGIYFVRIANTKNSVVAKFMKE